MNRGSFILPSSAMYSPQLWDKQGEVREKITATQHHTLGTIAPSIRINFSLLSSRPHDTNAIGPHLVAETQQNRGKMKRKQQWRFLALFLSVRGPPSKFSQKNYRRYVGAFLSLSMATPTFPITWIQSREYCKEKIVNPLPVWYDFEFYSSPICWLLFAFRVFKEYL